MVDYRYINSFRNSECLGGFTKSNKSMSVHAAVLMLSFFVGCSTDSSPVISKSTNEKSPISTNNSSAVGQSPVDRLSIDDEGSKTLECDDPNGYSVEEGTVPGTNSVNIVRGGTVLHTIKLPTDRERNGFGFNGAKKNKGGFEISIEYGSVIYYHKTFLFMCRQHKFYLGKIKVDSFDRHNPAKWKRKVINVRPNLPLEKFSITDFMLEGAAQR
jgi:hypothetical protein